MVGRTQCAAQFKAAVTTRVETGKIGTSPARFPMQERTQFYNGRFWLVTVAALNRIHHCKPHGYKPYSRAICCSLGDRTLLYRGCLTLHMMSVRIAPEDPIRAPTMVSNGLSIMKPSAHSAHPEYELSTVITWGMYKHIEHPHEKHSTTKYA